MEKNKIKPQFLFLFIILITTYLVSSNIIYLICICFWIYFLIRNRYEISLFLKSSNSQVLVFFLFFSVFVGLFNAFRNFNIIVGIVLTVFSFFTAVIGIYKTEEFNLSLKQLLIIYQAFLFFFIIKNGFVNFPREVPLEKIIDGSSANGFTTTLTLIHSAVFLSNYYHENRGNLTLSIMTVLICLTGYGRGSLILALVIFLLSLHLKFKEYKIYKNFFLIALAVLISTYLVITNYDNLVYFIQSSTKLSAGFIDYSREIMLRDYFHKIMDDMNYLFLGTDFKNTSIENYNGNPHNSFIRIHSFFGINYFIFHVILIIMFYSKFKSTHELIIVSSLGLFILIRVFTEVAFGASILDFLLYHILFLGIYRKTKNYRSYLR